MHRGVEIDIHLRAGLHGDEFVARAIGNLAAYRLQKKRGEALDWQVLRVDESSRHHFRLIVRHPERVLEVGFKSDLAGILEELSNETITQLRERFMAAEREGMKPVPLRRVKEEVDFWRDDFWNYIG